MEWISVNDKLPPDESDCLVIQRYKAGTYGSNEEVSVPWVKIRRFRKKDGFGVKKTGNIEVLCWMEIPKCPADIKYHDLFGI